MTTNAGSDKGSAISGFSENAETVMKEKTERALSQFLRPEFINRIDEIITFRHLTTDDFKRIAAIMLGELRDHLANKGITFKFSEKVCEYIAAKSYSEKFGARNMRRYVERNIEDEIANILIDSYPSVVSGVSVSVRADKLKFDFV
jgi:ATP-dependent Clp protease ATP-binding subunit ClpA